LSSGPEKYPLGGSAIHKVTTLCGVENKELEKLFYLKIDCLKTLARNANSAQGIANAEKAVKDIPRTKPYIPFTPPEYGGVGGIL